MPAGWAKELARLGGFFVIEPLDVPAGWPGAGTSWRPMGELVSRPERLRERVAAVRAALAGQAGRAPEEIELPVAASVAQLGLVARLLAPAVGAAALGQPLALWRGEQLWWQDRLGGPFPLALTAGPSRAGQATAATGTALTGSLVEALTEATAGRFRLSGRVLWGNVASAVNSAARLVGVTRPELAAASAAAADALLADPRLEGGLLRSGPSFRRRSCCLMYRLAGGRPSPVCGDCVLADDG